MAFMHVIVYGVGIILATGALFACFNTMYAAVASRGLEIATLRALGYGGFAIALSVLLSALNNLRPVVAERSWAVAFAFLLLHGLGLACVLTVLGLTQGALLLALFGFNLGVELGQLVSEPIPRTQRAPAHARIPLVRCPRPATVLAGSFHASVRGGSPYGSHQSKIW